MRVENNWKSSFLEQEKIRENFCANGTTEPDFSAFGLFQEQNMYISVPKSKVVRGNLKIFMSRENRKGSLASNLFNPFSISYLFKLAYSDYISLGTKPASYH